MNTDYVQAIRYKLQKRFRKVNSSTANVFHFSLVQFWRYLSTESFLRHYA